MPCLLGECKKPEYLPGYGKGVLLPAADRQQGSSIHFNVDGALTCGQRFAIRDEVGGDLCFDRGDSCRLSKPVNPTGVKRSTAACFVIVISFLLLAKCFGGESKLLPEAKLLASI